MRVTICSRTGWSRWTSIILCAWILGSCGPASLGSGECSEASCDAAPTPQDSGTAPIDATSHGRVSCRSGRRNGSGN